MDTFREASLLLRKDLSILPKGCGLQLPSFYRLPSKHNSWEEPATNHSPPKNGASKGSCIPWLCRASLNASRTRLVSALPHAKWLPYTLAGDHVGVTTFGEESDFHYMTSPVRKGCTWDKACMWCGVPLLIAGVVAVLIGQLVPPREPVVARRGNFAYLDRRALTFNSRLELCRLVGLGALCTAALMILLSFLIAAYSTQAQEYTPIVTAHTTGGGIPLSGVLTQVQPAAVHVPPRR